jgi:ankyrin repeat protein
MPWIVPRATPRGTGAEWAGVAASERGMVRLERIVAESQDAGEAQRLIDALVSPMAALATASASPTTTRADLTASSEMAEVVNHRVRQRRGPRRAWRCVFAWPAVEACEGDGAGEPPAEGRPVEVFWSSTEDEARQAWSMITALPLVADVEQRACRPLSALTRTLRFVDDHPLLTKCRMELIEAFSQIAESHGRDLGDAGGADGALAASTRQDDLAAALTKKDSSRVQELLALPDCDSNLLICTVPALSMAAGLGDVRSVRHLLAAGADVAAVSGLTGRTALHAAASAGSSGVCAALLQAGADLASLDSHDCTPLLLAAVGSHSQVVQFLLRRGADPTICDADGAGVLSWCSRNNLGSCVRILLRHEHGVDVDSQDTFQDTPLHRAAEMGHAAVAQMLIDAGAEIDVAGSDGDTPLIRATKSGRLDCVRVLMLAGADYFLKTVDGASAADISRASAISRMLVAHNGVRVQGPYLQRAIQKLDHVTSDMVIQFAPSSRIIHAHRFVFACHWEGRVTDSLIVEQSSSPEIRSDGSPSCRLVIPDGLFSYAAGLVDLVYERRTSVSNVEEPEQWRQSAALMGLPLTFSSDEQEVRLESDTLSLLRRWSAGDASQIRQGAEPAATSLGAAADVHILSPATSDRILLNHRCLLAHCSDVFRAMLYGGMREASEARVSLTISQRYDGGDASRIATAFSRFLNSEHFGVGDGEVLETEDILPLLTVAEQYGVVRLRQLCEDFLAKSINGENVCGLLQFADMFSAGQLRASCINYIAVFWSSLGRQGEFLEELEALSDGTKWEVENCVEETGDELTEVTAKRRSPPPAAARRNTDHW